MANKGAVDGVDGENGSRTVSTALGAGSHSSIPAIQPADSPMCFVELAKGIEPSTCGLQNSSVPHSTNQTPYRTTKHIPADLVTDGPELSCPGNRVVTDSSHEGLRSDVIDVLAVSE